jgi:hypothetical protein
MLVLAGSLLSLLAARSLSASPPRFLLLCAALFRATLLLRPADLSDDLHRYLWDAAVSATGRSPYADAPSDPGLASVAPGLRARVAHPEIRTVYPPVAQASFRVATLLEGGPLGMKILFGTADVAVVLLLAVAGGRDFRFAAALYAFHPLAVTETAGQGHVDPLGIALLLASILLLGRGSRALAGLALALSVLVKYVSLFALPALARRGRVRLAAAFAAACAGLWLAASLSGASPAGGLGEYARRWEFNGILYPAALGLVQVSELPERAKAAFLDLKEALDHPVWTQSVFPYFYEAFFARALLGLCLFAVLAVVTVRVRDPWNAAFASIGALLVISPTLHPWYLLWALPFAAVRREPAFLYLSSVAPLSYVLLYPVPGVSPQAVRAIELAPFAILLAGTLVRRWRIASSERRPAPSPV